MGQNCSISIGLPGGWSWRIPLVEWNCWTHTEFDCLSLVYITYRYIQMIWFVKIKIPLNSGRISHPRGDLRPSNGARSWFWLPMIKSTVKNQTKINNNNNNNNNNNTLKREKDPLWSIAANAFRRLSSRQGVNTALSRCALRAAASKRWRRTDAGRKGPKPRVTGWWMGGSPHELYSE